MRTLIIVFGVIGLLIGVYLPTFSILWELSEMRGACQNCPVNFWKNTTASDILNISLMGLIGALIGVGTGFLIGKLFKKIFRTTNKLPLMFF